MSYIYNVQIPFKLLTLGLILTTVGLVIQGSYTKQAVKTLETHSKVPKHTRSLLKASANNCTECHNGIEDIRNNSSGMMQAILKEAKIAGFEGNDCIICHGGNPNTKQKDLAHQGSPAYFKHNKGPQEFYPDPGSPWINENTCGLCHQEQVAVQFNSLMATEAGKIQGSHVLNSLL